MGGVLGRGRRGLGGGAGGGDLVRELGLAAVGYGGLKSARHLEPLAMLWIAMAYPLGQGPGFGLAVLRRG